MRGTARSPGDRHSPAGPAAGRRPASRAQWSPLGPRSPVTAGRALRPPLEQPPAGRQGPPAHGGALGGGRGMLTDHGGQTGTDRSGEGLHGARTLAVAIGEPIAPPADAVVQAAIELTGLDDLLPADRHLTGQHRAVRERAGERPQRVVIGPFGSGPLPSSSSTERSRVREYMDPRRDRRTVPFSSFGPTDHPCVLVDARRSSQFRMDATASGAASVVVDAGLRDDEQRRPPRPCGQHPSQMEPTSRTDRRNRYGRGPGRPGRASFGGRRYSHGTWSA